MADKKEDSNGSKKQRRRMVFVKCVTCGRRVREEDMSASVQTGSHKGTGLCLDCNNKTCTRADGTKERVDKCYKR